MANLKLFPYNDTTQLQKNINIRELVCRGRGHTHDTLIDLDHIKNIQDFMNQYGLTKVIFSRAYSCEEYNRQIGGARNSYHVKGYASDQCFYKGDKIVRAQEICCMASDFGFKGVAIIDNNYVHLDSRPRGLYRGDERLGYDNNIPNNDFYTYFGIDNRVNPTKFNLKRVLRLNCKGNDVIKLQEELLKRGYYLGEFGTNKNGVDGYFGKLTKDALKKFQMDNKLDVDGVVGPATAHKFDWLYNGN